MMSRPASVEAVIRCCGGDGRDDGASALFDSSEGGPSHSPSKC